MMARITGTFNSADSLIDKMQATIKAQWHKRRRARGITARDIEKISGCFLPEGFEDKGSGGNPEMM